MLRQASYKLGLPEFPSGSVWSIGAGEVDQCQLSPLAVYALGTADAVLHDPGLPQPILDLVTPPRYREAAVPEQAIERSIKLAQDGWRVVHLVGSNTVERALESAIRYTERNIPFRIVPSACEPIGREAPLGLLLARKPNSVGGADPQPTLVLVIATPQSEAATGQRRPPPLRFSMSGLAG